jgi:hypothetical protein
MTRPASVLIVGAGLAGARCAETLRADGYEGRITLVGEEPVAPYERPALSKEFLAGDRAANDLLLRPPGFWAEREIELVLGPSRQRPREQPSRGGGRRHGSARTQARGTGRAQCPCPAHAR